MMRLYSLDADEQIIGIHGQEEEALTARWRQLFAYVPQEFMLMSGTVHEIVSLPDRSLIDDVEKIWQSLSVVIVTRRKAVFEICDKTVYFSQDGSLCATEQEMDE